MMPPMHMMGVATMKFSPISTSIWTCWTSLVPRVMRVGAPNVFTSLAEKLVTLRNTPRRRSRPTAMAVLEPKYTPAMAVPTWTKATSEHHAAGAPDEVGVAAGNAFVDDLGVEAGQVEGRDGGRQLESDDGQDVRHIRFGIAPYEGDKHAHGSLGREREMVREVVAAGADILSASHSTKSVARAKHRQAKIIPTEYPPYSWQSANGH